MGCYDEFDGIQLKVGDCVLKSYQIGDAVPISDGLYAGYGGIVVIVGGKLVASFQDLHNKWGGHVEIDLDGNNPLTAKIVQMENDQLKERLAEFEQGEFHTDTLRRNAEARLADAVKDAHLYAAKHARCEERLAEAMQRIEQLAADNLYLIRKLKDRGEKP